MNRTTRRGFLAVVGSAMVLGCNREHKFSKDDLAKARSVLETCLESWKNGEMPGSLRARPEPIDFVEEGPTIGLKLLSYQIVSDQHTDSETMRFTVVLTVRDRKGKQEERRATYGVALRSPIAVGRDPMY